VDPGAQRSQPCPIEGAEQSQHGYHGLGRMNTAVALRFRQPPPVATLVHVVLDDGLEAETPVDTLGDHHVHGHQGGDARIGVENVDGLGREQCL
jgi:hypothetical protein